MFDAIASALAWFYDLVPNYAIAIAMLTLTIMILLTPLTLRGTRSMMAMQQYQPEIRRIQKQYAGDRQKMNEEMLKFYQEHQINPLGGCLPLLVQAPVFIVLYRVIDGLTNTNNGEGPSYLDHGTQMFVDLRDAGGEMVAFGVDLAVSANQAIQDSVVASIPHLVMVAIVAGTSYFQQRQMRARSRNSPGPDTPQAQQMQMMMKFLPFMLPVFSFFMPSALVVYFIVSNLYRVGQQSYIQRTNRRDAEKPDGPDPKPGRPDAELTEGEEGGPNGSSSPNGRSGGSGKAKKPAPHPKSRSNPGAKRSRKRK